MKKSLTSFDGSNVRLLLVKYQCPSSYPRARALFMGSIASPKPQGSSLDALAALWGGTMPIFDSQTDLEEVLSVFLSGLWNHLTHHHDRKLPFRFIRTGLGENAERESLKHLVAIRLDEIQGFLDGFFGMQDVLDLSAKADWAVLRLQELESMLMAAFSLLAEEDRPTDRDGLRELAQNLRKMTFNMEDLINQIIQSCKRLRAGHLVEMAETSTPRFLNTAPGAESSPLSQMILCQGQAMDVQIYEDGEGRWMLEIINAGGTSFVWDDRFDTEEDALAEARRALEEDFLDFLNKGDGEAIH